MRAPIVITGMHRSGTTLLVAFLRDCGAFFGSQLDPNLEDFFFLRRNEWLLRRAGGSWDQPEPFLEDLNDPARLAQMQATLRKQVNSFEFRRRHGLQASLRGLSPEQGNALWGWKDPRAVFTLPAWQTAFPEARLIHIRRDGVDVAASLRERERRRQSVAQTPNRQPWRPGILDRLASAWQGVDFLDEHLFPSGELPLQTGFELWEQYVTRGEQLVADHAGDTLALTFEELAKQPEQAFERVANFAGVSLTPSLLERWTRKARPERAQAWKQTPELVAFHESVAQTPMMRALGYGANDSA